MFEFEKEYFDKGYELICGCDEAGRGPLCGPVVAAAVILPKNFHSELINDSKKLSEKKRELAFEEIKNNALAYSIIFIDPKRIDEINILNASREAMEKAILSLKIKPEFILTDAMKLKNVDIPFEDIIKGDAKCECIAAASILAKVSRDKYMKEMALKFPQYELDKHKGYPTKRHIELVEKYGIIPDFYRLTYGPIKKIIEK